MFYSHHHLFLIFHYDKNFSGVIPPHVSHYKIDNSNQIDTKLCQISAEKILCNDNIFAIEKKIDFNDDGIFTVDFKINKEYYKGIF